MKKIMFLESIRGISALFVLLFHLKDTSNSVIIQNSEQIVATYKYEYTYGLSEVISKQHKILGEWYFCHQFDNKFIPVEHGDTITLKRYATTGNCTDLHYLNFFSNGSMDYSSDTTKLSGLPYPDNYKNWSLNERGIFFTKKNGLPSDAWKVLFKDDETLLLIYDWDRPE